MSTTTENIQFENNLNNEVYITPQMFGAKGDGIADDTKAFIEAFKYPCFIPAGTYRICQTITIKHDVIGFSRDSVIIKPDGCNIVFHAIDGVGLKIENINIIGHGKSKGETALVLENVRNSYFNQLRLTQCQNGIQTIGNTWANVFDRVGITRCTNGILNIENTRVTFDTTVFTCPYIGQCDSAFKITSGSMDILGGWIEECKKVYDVTNINNINGIACTSVDFENNGILFSIGGGTYPSSILQFVFTACKMYNFQYWFDNNSNKNHWLYFDVRGGVISKPIVDIFTENSLYCIWGTNLPDTYIKQTSPYKLYKCKICSTFTETSIPVDLIDNCEYVFPEQIYLSSMIIPNDITATVYGYDGKPIKTTLNPAYDKAGEVTYRSVAKPCYKIVFSKQPTADVSIKVPLNTNIVVR